MLRLAKNLCLSIYLILFFGCNAQSPVQFSINNSDNSKVEIDISNNTEIKQVHQIRAKQNETLKSYLAGSWKRDVESGGCYNLWISFPSSNYLCVVDNQIYIEVLFKLKNKDKKVYVYVKKTRDLGEWAIKLNWKDFDKRKPIAIIDVSKTLSEGTIDVKWIGFVNKKTGEVYDFGKDDHEGTHRKQAVEK
jgi:hypothetical protein